MLVEKEEKEIQEGRTGTGAERLQSDILLSESTGTPQISERLDRLHYRARMLPGRGEV